MRTGTASLLNELGELALDERARRLNPAIEIDCGNQRFLAVRDERVLATPTRLLFSPAEDQEVAERNLLAQPSQ
jgi:hypothetical protein